MNLERPADWPQVAYNRTMWHEKDQALVKEFEFLNFATALAFVVRIGELAEVANHHPDICLSWGKVVVSLTTHDAGGVTDVDRQMAAEIDKIDRRYKSS